MKYFLFYEDHNGYVGFESFDTEELAIAFIRARLQQPNRTDYRLIQGTELKLEPFERVLDVRVSK